MRTTSACGILLIAIANVPAVNAGGVLNALGPLPENPSQEIASWPGKETPVRAAIELTKQAFSGCRLEVRRPLRDERAVIFLLGEDGSRQGKLEIKVYPTIEAAHQRLGGYVLYSSSGMGPPRLGPAEFPWADVAYGYSNEQFTPDGLSLGRAWNVDYARANVVINLVGDAALAGALPAIMDGIIQSAPIWQPGDSEPRIVMSQEFREGFLPFHSWIYDGKYRLEPSDRSVPLVESVDIAEMGAVHLPGFEAGRNVSAGWGRRVKFVRDSVEVRIIIGVRPSVDEIEELALYYLNSGTVVTLEEGPVLAGEIGDVGDSSWWRPNSSEPVSTDVIFIRRNVLVIVNVGDYFDGLEGFEGLPRAIDQDILNGAPYVHMAEPTAVVDQAWGSIKAQLR